MKLTRLILSSLVTVSALPAVSFGQLDSDYPVPAHISRVADEPKEIVPVFVDPNITVSLGDGSSWNSRLALDTLGGALPMPSAYTAPDGIQIVVLEYLEPDPDNAGDFLDDHRPITVDEWIPDFLTVWNTTFGNDVPVVAVRWGYDESNRDSGGNARKPHSLESVVDGTYDGSYQTILPGAAAPYVVAAGTLQSFFTYTNDDGLSALFLDGVNISEGLQEGVASPNERGAGLFIDPAAPLTSTLFITNTQFTLNFARELGGAIYIPDGNAPVVIANSDFWGNEVETTGGGAIYNESDELSIYQSTFDTNLAAQGQGGAYYGFPQSDADFVSNVFYNNNADQQGGAVYVSNSATIAIVNNHFVENTSELNGGAIFFAETAGLTVDNPGANQTSYNTVDGAVAATNIDGGTVYPTFWNNVFIDNSGDGSTADGNQVRFTIGNPLQDFISNGDAASQDNQFYVGTAPVRNLGDPRGADNILGDNNGFCDDGIQPTGTGALFDAGTNAVVPDIGYFISADNLTDDYFNDSIFPFGFPLSARFDALDVKNDPRIQDIVEVGAYEVEKEIVETPPPPKIIYVDDNAPGDENGVHDGNTWESAYLFLQDALKRAELDPSVTEIWVAEAENMEKNHILTREALPARDEFINEDYLYWQSGVDVRLDEGDDLTPLGVLRTDEDDEDLPRADEIPAWKVPATYCVISGADLDEQVRKTAYNPGRRTGLYVTVGDVDGIYTENTYEPHFTAIATHGLLYGEASTQSPSGDHFGVWGPYLPDGTLNVQIPYELDRRPIRGTVPGTSGSPRTHREEPYPVPSYFTKDRLEELARTTGNVFRPEGRFDVVIDVPITYLRQISGDPVRTIIYSKQDVPMNWNGSEIPYFFAFDPLLGGFPEIRVEFYNGRYLSLSHPNGTGEYNSPFYTRLGVDDLPYDPTDLITQISGYASPTDGGNLGVAPSYQYNVRRDLDDRRVMIYGGYDGWRVSIPAGLSVPTGSTIEEVYFSNGDGEEVPNVFVPELDVVDRVGVAIGGVVEPQYQVTFLVETLDDNTNPVVSMYDRELFLAQRSDDNETILSGDLDLSKYLFTFYEEPGMNILNSWVDNRHSYRIMQIHSDAEMLSNVDRGHLMLESHLQVNFVSGEADLSQVDDLGPTSASGSSNSAVDPDWYSLDEIAAMETFNYTYDGDTEITLMTRDRHNYIVEQLTIRDAMGGDGAGLYLDDTYAKINNLYFAGNRGSNGAAIYAGSNRSDTGPVISDSCFEDNFATGLGGAILVESYADVSIDNSNFLHNEASMGGALAVAYGEYKMRLSTDLNGSGGGYAANSAALITNTVFAANNAARAGGAVYASTVGDLTFDKTLFTGNNATSGGAIYAEGSILDVMHSVLSENTAYSGPALQLYDSSPYLLNTVVYRNMSQTSAIDDPFAGPLSGPSSPIIHNSVITGKIGFTIPNGHVVITADPMFDSVDAFKGPSGVYFYPYGETPAPVCGIVMDRQYDDLNCAEVNAGKGDDGIFGTTDDTLGFMLTDASPAKNAGSYGQDIGIYESNSEDEYVREPSMVESVFDNAIYVGGDWVRVPELNNDHMWTGWEPYVYSINHGWVYPIAAADGLYLWIYNGSWKGFFIDLDNFDYPLADDLFDDSDELVPLPFTGM